VRYSGSIIAVLPLNYKIIERLAPIDPRFKSIDYLLLYINGAKEV